MNLSQGMLWKSILRFAETTLNLRQSMTSDNKYSKVLLELKTRYQQTLTNLETQTSQLKTKITSLDTLIEDPLLGSDLFSILQGELDSLTSATPATDSKTTQTVKPKAEAKPKKTPPKASPSSGKRKPSASQKSASSPKSTKTGEPKSKAKSKGAAPKASPSTPKRPTSAPKTTEKVEPKAETTQKASPSSSKKKSATPKKPASQAATKKKNQKKSSGSSSSILTMNKPYDQMKKIDAITKIMHENSGKVMHNDDLILQLYGELSGDVLKAERGRIKAAMYQGAQNDRWEKDPNVKACYIYKPSLNTKPAKSNTTKGQKSRKKT